MWERFYVDADDVYKGFVTGCALAGPDGCPLSTELGQTPSEVNDIVQGVLKAARDAAIANSSVPLTSGDLRSMSLSLAYSVVHPSNAPRDVAQLHTVMYLSFTWAVNASQWWPTVTKIVDAESLSENTAAPESRSSDVIRMRQVSLRALLNFSYRLIGCLLLSVDTSNMHESFLGRRGAADNDSPTFATTAIACSDSLANPNTNTTMKELFQSLVDASRNLSHMCWYSRCPMMLVIIAHPNAYGSRRGVP